MSTSELSLVVAGLAVVVGPVTAPPMESSQVAVSFLPSDWRINWRTSKVQRETHKKTET
jgi:hypothetical protein